MTDGLFFCPECRNALFVRFRRQLPDECPACGHHSGKPDVNPFERVR